MTKQDIKDKIKIMHWLIDGYGRTGWPLSVINCDWLDRHWLVKHYNVEYSYFDD